ncbi:hypothetical protein [Pseudarthrobacter sulfonivorans]|uniref:hypothetical protein n=1 Tax=Pseudarthrobacter sulfonivorans TaxID=121292 RepID=UPI002855539A|nr:hypothetical protein [Pseudarthrobacter sulfonivorans]MDR6414493.1 hypothetical protein [Pseudarthrobacter sulfonivorans]
MPIITHDLGRISVFYNVVNFEQGGPIHERNKDPYWQATVEDSTSVLPAGNVSVKADGGRLTAELPAVSWSMIRLAVAS